MKFLFVVFIGCLQSVYGIHTLRIESIAHGKAAPVDELLVQGVSNPGLLRKVNNYLICVFVVIFLMMLWTTMEFTAFAIL